EALLILYDNEYKECEDTIIQFQQLIENHYNELKHKLHGLQNTKKKMARLQLYEVQRLSSVYIQNIDYMSRCIRGWAKDFLVQGFFQVISKESIQKDHSPLSLKKELEATIFPKLIGVSATIFEMTMRKFMHLWSFHKRAIGQQVYFDRHERKDMKIVILLEWLEISDLRHVIVTHDEIYFYANDDMSYVWLKDSKFMIKKKGQEGSIIVSDFLCSYHGSLQLIEKDFIRLGLEQYA
ncbi:41287_t:CDS:2, partial [Gigaspora margarita]